MSKKKKTNRPYERFGNVLAVDTTMIQALSLLDEVAVRAVQSGDNAMMLATARQWMELGAFMHVAMGGSDEKDGGPADEDGDHNGSAILGFGPTAAREIAEAKARERKSQR